MACACGEKRESTRELVQQSSNGERGSGGERKKKKSAEEGPEALPLWLIWAAGEGSGIKVRRWNPVWPGVAGICEKLNRRIGAEDPGVEKRNAQRGDRGLQLRQVVRGSWAPAH